LRASSVLQALLFLTSAAAFVLMFAELYREDLRGLLATFLVCVAAAFMAAWIRGPLKLAWGAYALLAAGLAVDGRWLAAVVALAALVALVVYGIAGTVRLLRRLGSLETEPVGAEQVMTGAEAEVAKFEAEGFRRVGGYSATINERPVIFTVMVGPDADRFAVVTDNVVQVTSRFGGRFLVTTNAAGLPMPTDLLRQRPAYGTHVMPVHQSAIELLARFGLRPDVLETDADALEAAQALERRAARFLAGSPLRNVLGHLTGIEVSVLADDGRSRRRIEAWTKSASPAAATSGQHVTP
jgi:hypothetical protein